ncbi:hypothetical protein LTR36_007578 [Oleoguttula mirabilis]|uniref:Uncharacterized protein n=1 Tax=Oleoguttula mirabilis TaxID=1507867 RepID=A0AAV9JTT8_9PEZI|nr:hypothetical protein LTR36_007578 [Oleoguttula mirabilis]
MAALKLTAGETKLLPLAFECFEAPPKVDSKKLAELGGYKNAASANTCWYNLKNKLVPQNGKAAENTTLTTAEYKLLALAWKSFESVPKVNNKKLAELGKYKTPASANSCWYALKKKLLSADDTASSTAATSAKSSPKKRTGSDDVGGEDATPKKKRGRKSKAAVKEEEDLGPKIGTTVEGAEDSDDDLEVVAPKREIMTDTRALKLEVLREIEAEAAEVEAEHKGMQIGGEMTKREVMAEDEEVPKDFLEQVAEYSGEA